MSKRHFPTNAEMYDLFKQHLVLPEEVPTLQMPVHIEDILKLKECTLAQTLSQSLIGDESIKGVYHFKVSTHNQQCCDALAVAYTRLDGKTIANMALRYEDDIIESYRATAKECAKLWSTDVFNLHQLVLARYDIERIYRCLGEAEGKQTHVCKYVASLFLKAKERWELSMCQDMLLGDGDVWMWYDYLKWCTDTARLSKETT